MSDHEFTEDWDAYWQDDARTDRDEHDLQVRAWEDVERDRRDRDVGESGLKGKAA